MPERHGFAEEMRIGAGLNCSGVLRRRSWILFGFLFDRLLQGLKLEPLTADRGLNHEPLFGQGENGDTAFVLGRCRCAFGCGYCAGLGAHFEFAGFEILKRSRRFEKYDFGKCWAADLRADRGLGHNGFANDVGFLIHKPPPAGAADDEPTFAYARENRITL